MTSFGLAYWSAIIAGGLTITMGLIDLRKYNDEIPTHKLAELMVASFISMFIAAVASSLVSWMGAAWQAGANIVEMGR